MQTGMVITLASTGAFTYECIILYIVCKGESDSHVWRLLVLFIFVKPSCGRKDMIKSNECVLQ